MKENVFVKQNKEKWDGYERKLKSINHLSTDSLSDIYLDLSSDLAYSQSQFPYARVTLYLNNMVRTVQECIYTPRKRNLWSLVTFFTEVVPRNVAEARNELLVSFSLFMAFVIIGVVLTHQDMKYVMDMLGSGYVSQTLENIKNGKPTDIYSDGNSSLMFLSIFWNNIGVVFRIYAAGIIPIIGPGYFLCYNGLMLGEFQQLFFNYGVGLQSMLSIWIHGTLEISSIIIGGAAGLALGNGWIFPGTYSRLESFKRAGLRSVRILSSTLPLFLIAAFFEGFVTRHAEWPNAVKLMIILLSLLFILFYYVYLPYLVRRDGKKKNV
jgi:uncharacterized membrane protein SpoIIM required for sporulation